MEVDVEAEDDLKVKDIMCFYCKKKKKKGGHIVAGCPVLKKQSVKPVALVNKLDKNLNEPVLSKDMSIDLTVFTPFVICYGWCCLVAW